MHSKKANILQIQKYLSGKLDGPAMHKLEMQALDDPFLMDALEGYESSSANQSLNLSDLSNRLQQRVKEKQGFVIPWKVWPIAASVLIVLTIGGLYIKKSGDPALQRQKNIVANNNPTPVTSAVADTIKAADTTKTPLAANQTPQFLKSISKRKTVKPAANSIYQQEISAGDNKMASNTAPAANSGFNSEPPAVSQNKPDNTFDKKPATFGNASLDERVAMGYMASPLKKDSAKQNLLGLNAKTTPKAPAPGLFKLQGKVDGVTSTPAPGYSNKAATESLYIAGTIISRDDGSPLIGAAIRIKGTNKSTVTDVNGRFALSSPADKATLDVVYIGYEPKQINATRGDSVKVALKPDVRALSEVVVTRSDNSEEASVTAAHPQLGWGSLKKYLQTNAVLPDGSTGTVTVMFTVYPSGIVDEFGIKKGLNETADQKAIELIKNGPSWVGSSNNKPEQVTVKVKFQKAKQ